MVTGPGRLGRTEVVVDRLEALGPGPLPARNRSSAASVDAASRSRARGNRGARISHRWSMEKMSAQPDRSPSTVPLARDADGNVIELPDGAVGWRIRRQTGGRPRLLLDSRKQPMLFPLDYTIADADDILSPGNYLLDAVDKNGEPLGVTIAVSIGMPRNAQAIEPEHDEGGGAPVVVPTTLPNTTNDVRLVLEANVRATQMAFIHNQRTLETGLRMAETLRDSVQVLATSQADWIKSVSSARGFFRNGGQSLAPVEVKQLTVMTGHHERDGEAEAEDQDDDDGYPSDSAAQPSSASAHWSEKFMPLISQVVMQVMPAINAWSAKQYADATGRRAGAETGRPTEQDDAAAKAEEQQAREAEQEHAAKLEAAITAAASPGPGINVMKMLQLLPQRTAAKLMQIQGALAPEEQTDAMHILRTYTAAGLMDLLRVFDAASLEQCTGFLRGLIAEWRAREAARRDRGNDPRSNGGDGASGNGSAEPR